MIMLEAVDGCEGAAATGLTLLYCPRPLAGQRFHMMKLLVSRVHRQGMAGIRSAHDWDKPSKTVL